MILYEFKCLKLRNKKYKINSILFVLLLIFITFKYEILCYECLKNEKNECRYCKNEVLFKGIKRYDDYKTLNEIIYKNKSIARYGDGEFAYIYGAKLRFQKYDKNLSQRLLDILNKNEKNLLIGIVALKLKHLKNLNGKSYKSSIRFLKKYRFKLAKILKNSKYYSSTISRFYIEIQPNKNIPKYINKLKLIWENKNIVIVEGDKSRLGVGNDFFDNARSIQRIICPNFNAFTYYSKILNTIKNKVDLNKLIIIALGPTATVLAYDLSKYGYQAIDLGHADIEYEWYLRKAKRKIAIPNKYVNEVKRRYKVDLIHDEKYESQIIAKISNMKIY